MKSKYLYIGIVGLTLLFCQCSKSKMNDNIQPPGVLTNNNSSIRLVNFLGFPVDVTINNIPLTSYNTNNQAGTAEGTAIFPSGVWNDGVSFFIPNNVLDKNGNAEVKILPRASQRGESPLPPIDTVIANTPLSPTDYYLLGNGRFLPLPRSAAVPTQPSDFKIRLINLADSSDLNNLTGPMTLTYADGTPVDSRLTGVLPGQISDYVELPYGSFEFKVFANSNFTQQMSEFSVMPNFILGAGLPGTPVLDQEARFGPIRTFKPGGTYTIFVAKYLVSYITYYGETIPIPVNCYRLVSDNSPPVNLTYARIQAVNAYTDGGAIKIKLDGRDLADTLSFGSHTDFGILINGVHELEAYDQRDSLIVQQSFTLYPYDNITAWIYRNDTTGAQICFSNNNMASVATSLQMQFLNLSPGIDYVTFTNDAVPFIVPNFSQVTDSASTNVPFGQPIILDPYINLDLTPTYLLGSGFAIIPPPVSFILRVFQSSPGPPQEIPGRYLSDVSPLYPNNFIANRSIYSSPTFPSAEPGAYTIALIGREGSAPTDPYHARLLLLKQSK